MDLSIGAGCLGSAWVQNPTKKIIAETTSNNLTNDLEQKKIYPKKQPPPSPLLPSLIRLPSPLPPTPIHPYPPNISGFSILQKNFMGGFPSVTI